MSFDSSSAMRQAFTGPLTSKTKKDYLVSIALALRDNGLEAVLTEGNRNDIKNSIEKTLAAHEGSLSADPTFQGLYAYRSGTEESTKDAKRSTDKDNEDAAAAVQDAGKQATGYVQTQLKMRHLFTMTSF